MSIFLLPILFLSSTQIIPSAATDTITPSQPLVAGQTLISAGGTFELGFFNASSPSSSFLGIWYHKIPIREIVWVANRRSPITTRNATLSLTTNGNVLITVSNVNGGGGIRAIWSKNFSDIKIPSLKLLDSGNLVLTDRASGAIIWQSFYDPYNALLPDMKLGLHLTATSHFEKRLLSWKSPDDPSPGRYTFRLRHTNSSELVVLNGSNILYRTGPWTEDFWSGFPQMNSDHLLNLSSVYEDVPNDIYFTYESANQSVMTLINLDPSGVLQRLVWLGGQWKQYWRMPVDKCDRYGTCGPFGVCNVHDPEGVCRCLQGFEPRMLVDWTLRDYSGGCERKIALDCSERVDGFVKVSGVKPPDTENVTVAAGLGLKDCNALCLRQCSCVAYAVLKEGCLWWVGQLMDIKEFAQGTKGVVDLYLRPAATELDSAESAKMKHIVAVVIPLGLAFIMFFSCFGIYTLKKKRKQGDGYAKESRGEEMELTVFDMSAIQISTNNFSDENKLGQGGFGPVYKGRLGDGQEIAVKRLSKSSDQGSDEFMNEVMVIAKLQHRNLVRLLGCCIHGEERLLIYEYMPNKSLDSFIFGYGYMSPEYVMHGIFSVKSDVFSFGFIVLEILTGKKNRVFDSNGSHVSLAGYAWRLWSENKSLELVDDALKCGYPEKEVLRCMHVGLLCVQEGIEDTPTMASVILMLGSDSMTLPQPKRPGFYPTDDSKVADMSTGNDITLTMIQGR
ncbi:hypothetical protein KFK09_015983 [Dendrobium nobile]|uniref:Receptor-like serine/threonine-protein kinase n=1 Tax=Dendrobium nobile TaxID=94219 RepID=A0A8T3BC04_DENNO|nr:hypothetical protein KFK09_015983 [Dendrobium nobile]